MNPSTLKFILGVLLTQAWCDSEKVGDATLKVKDPLSHQFTGLSPDSKYEVIGAAVNRKGTVEISRIYIHRNESQPGKVGNLNVSSIQSNYTAVTVSFTSPRNPNGNITKYVLNYTMLSPGHTDPACEVLKQITNRTNITIKASSAANGLYSQTVETSPETNYTFKVTAFNSLEGITAEIDYTTGSNVPGPIRDLQIHNVTSDSAWITWSPPSQPNGFLLGYKLKLNLDATCFKAVNLFCKGEKNSNVPTQAWCDSDSVIDTTLKAKDPLSYQFTGLSPDSKYEFIGAAVNSQGTGEISRIYIHTYESQPGKVGNLKVSSIQSNYTSVTVNFTSPRNPNGDITKYVLNYFMLSPGHTDPACEVLSQISNRTNITIKPNHTVNGLYSQTVEVSPETKYSFQVTAFNSMKGNTAEVKYTTGSDVPGPIRELQIHNVKSDSVWITWSPPTQPNGFLLGYKLQLNRFQPKRDDECLKAAILSCQGDKISNILTEAWCDTDRIIDAMLKVRDPLSYQFTGLIPYSNYELIGEAVNRRGTSKQIRVHFTTTESAPGPVRSLTFSPVPGDYSSLILHFTCLAPEERHGIVTHYIITYTVHNQTSESKCGMSAMIQNTSGITVDDDGSCNFSRRIAVTPEKHYNFTIQAYTTMPGAIASFETFTPYGSPGPVKELKARSITSSTVTVQWATPEHVNGMIHSYQISVELEGTCIFRYFTDCGDFNINQDKRKYEKECKNTGIPLTTNKIIHNGDLHSIRVNDLLSYTNYNISVVAINNNGSGPGGQVAFKTYIGVPNQPTDFNATVNSSSSITLFWTTSNYQAGQTSYIIFVYGNLDQRTNNYTEVNTLNITGYNTSSTAVANLLSYTYYNFTIMASTSAGKSECVSLNQAIRTGTGVPTAPRSLYAASVSPYIVNLSWTQSEHQAGPTTYLIDVYGKLDQGSGNYINVQNLSVPGFSNTSLIVQDLLSYTNYSFTIKAKTSAGESTTTDTALRTQPEAAAPPQNLNVENITAFSVRLSWMPSNHQCGATDYIVDVEEQPHLQAEFYILNRTITVYGFHNNAVDIADLTSYWKYSFSVRARTSVPLDSSLVTAQKQTLQSPPGRVENIQVSSLPDNYTAVKLTWDCPGERERHGPISHYTVQYSDKVYTFGNFPDGDPCRESHTAILPVHPEQSYQFTVSANAKYGGIKSVSHTFNAEAGRPVSDDSDLDPIMALLRSGEDPTVSQCQAIESAIDVSDMLDSGGPCWVGYNRTNLRENQQTPSETVTKATEIKSPTHPAAEDTMEAVTTDMEQPPANNTSDKEPPEVISTEIFTTTSSESSESTTDSTFLVSVNTNLLRDSTNGHVVMTALLVMRKNAGVDVPKNLTMTLLKNWRGWKEWKNDYKGTYRPTPDNWLIPQIRRRRGSTDDDGQSTTQFTVGANSDCENIQDVHCNGPVEADTTYRVISVACTSAGCTSSQPFGPFKTVKAIPAVAALVGGLLAALVVVGIVVGVLLYRRRRKRKNVNGTFESPVEEDVEEIENCVDNIRPKKISEISRLVDGYHKNADLQFSQEWREISRSSPIHPCQVASLEINRPKNCYVNILAYDHTRVRLLPKKERTESDYINANYIPGYSGPKDYIASQGPMAATVDDFWQMVWEQNVSVIVQLTEVYEKGRRMFTQYWPDSLNERVLYGDIAVEVLDASMIDKCTRRTFKVSLGSVTRTVEHFFLQDWQYNNLKPLEIIDFAKNVRTELDTNNEGPMIVHCSAGVGRTGTFICVDYFLQVIDKADFDDSIDIFSFVLKMRDCRPLMVQSESQYVFVHDVVKEMIQAKLKTRAGKGEDEVCQNQAFVEFEEEESSNETHT